MEEIVINRVKPVKSNNLSGRVLINRFQPNELNRCASKFKGIYDLYSRKNTFNGKCRLDISSDKLYDFFGSGNVRNEYYKIVF